MKILVAGGAGFLGSNLCARLIDYGDTVYCLDNLSTSSVENISDLYSNNRFHFIPGDVSKGVPEFGVDQIYNCASPTAPGHYQRAPEATREANVKGTINLLELARTHKARMLQTSTIRVTEELEKVVCVTDCFTDEIESPHACYVEGKRIAEALCQLYAFDNKVDVKLARLYNTYGPKMSRDDSRVVPQFVMRALRGDPLLIVGEGVQRDSFCYVDDMLDGLIAYMNSDIQFGPVEFGYPEPISILDLARLTISTLNSKSEIVFNGANRPAREIAAKMKRPVPNIDEARAILGWTPRVPLEDGIRRLAEYYGRTA
jgi:nucleoside-diphosphate-sugar epimerase